MRTLLLAMSATAMAIPATFALPTESAEAQSSYYRNGVYYGPTWQGQDGRYYCRRPNGTTGLIVGGAAGALIGRQLDGGRSRTTGTILGAAAGALIGREVQRSSSAAPLPPDHFAKRAPVTAPLFFIRSARRGPSGRRLRRAPSPPPSNRDVASLYAACRWSWPTTCAPPAWPRLPWPQSPIWACRALAREPLPGTGRGGGLAGGRVSRTTRARALRSAAVSSGASASVAALIIAAPILLAPRPRHRRPLRPHPAPGARSSWRSREHSCWRRAPPRR